MTLEDRKNIVPGQLILVYDKAKKALQQWVVVDGKGRRTTVAFDNMVPGVEPDPELFKIAVKRSDHARARRAIGKSTITSRSLACDRGH